MEEKFIHLVMENPMLYDKSSENFKDTKKKDYLWERIAGQCGLKSGKLTCIVINYV